MPHVSNQALDEKTLKRLFGQLFKTFKDAARKDSTDSIIRELLTPTEKIMFAKRLAIVLLLDRGIPQDLIAKQICVSTNTVTRMSLGMEMGKYDKILKVSGKKDIFDILERIILFSTPPRYGRGRWSGWGR